MRPEHATCRGAPDLPGQARGAKGIAGQAGPGRWHGAVRLRAGRTQKNRCPKPGTCRVLPRYVPGREAPKNAADSGITSHCKKTRLQASALAPPLPKVASAPPDDCSPPCRLGSSPRHIRPLFGCKVGVPCRLHTTSQCNRSHITATHCLVFRVKSSTICSVFETISHFSCLTGVSRPGRGCGRAS